MGEGRRAKGEGEGVAAWLDAFGAGGVDPEALGVAFAPATYKEVLDGALALGRAAGRLPEAMRVLAEGEARLRRLRDRLGLARRDRDHAGLPRVAVIARLDPLTLAGRWVPDLVAHAGGRPVLVAAGQPDRVVSVDGIAEAAPDVLIVLGRQHPEALLTLGRETALLIPPSLFLVPGPELVRAVEVLAAILHPGRFEPERRDGR